MTRELLNTLFVLTPNAFVRLDHDALRVEAENRLVMQVPLHHLGSIMLFDTAMISCAAMQRCAEEGRSIIMLDYAGRFKARVVGPVCGNVLLRQAQYEAARDDGASRDLARSIVAGNVRNSRYVLARGGRDIRDPGKAARLREAAEQLGDLLRSLPDQETTDQVRGIEGQAAALYFGVFGDLLTVPPSQFAFSIRTRRPPRDRVNALLSFLYAIVLTDCVSACEGVGLDPQFGYLHALRPGRPSLALDLMEEFRSILADRLALSLINRRQIQPDQFEERPGESVLLNESGRKAVLAAYQKRKQEEAPHPLLKENAPIGLFPHLQARVLARTLRGDLPGYLPYVVA